MEVKFPNSHDNETRRQIQGEVQNQDRNLGRSQSALPSCYQNAGFGVNLVRDGQPTRIEVEAAQRAGRRAVQRLRSAPQVFGFDEITEKSSAGSKIQNGLQNDLPKSKKCFDEEKVRSLDISFPCRHVDASGEPNPAGSTQSTQIQKDAEVRAQARKLQRSQSVSPAIGFKKTKGGGVLTTASTSVENKGPEMAIQEMAAKRAKARDLQRSRTFSTFERTKKSDANGSLQNGCLETQLQRDARIPRRVSSSPLNQ